MSPPPEMHSSSGALLIPLYPIDTSSNTISAAKPENRKRNTVPLRETSFFFMTFITLELLFPCLSFLLDCEIHGVRSPDLPSPGT